MILKSEIIEIASILDEDIKKAFEDEKTEIDVLEESISKGLSHDPFRPVLMNEESPYYNPYRQMEDGTFLPHPVEYWASQGKSTDNTQYLTTRVLYDQYLAPTEKRFSTLRRSLEKGDLIKAGAVPVGTVHTYRDGERYKKMAEGKWVPVAGQEGKVRAQAFQENWLNHKDPQKRAQAAQDLDRHASSVQSLKDEIKQRQREERVKDEGKKDTLKVVHQAMSSMFDGDMPHEIKGFFDKHLQPDKTPTVQKWKVGEAYKPERKEIHEKLLKPIENVKPVPPPEGQKPVAILSAGGAGSGKSSVLKSIMPNFKDKMAYISADDYKEQLPEYKQLASQGVDDAAPLVHDESSDISSEAVNRAMEGGKPFVYDSTMKNTEKFSKLIQNLKNKGYEVHIVFAHLDPEKAKARANARKQRTGRKVDERVIEESNKDARKSLMALKHLADSVRVYSTEEENKPPKLLHRSGRDELLDKLNKSDADQQESNSDALREFISAFEGANVGQDERLEHHGESPDFDKRLKYKGEKK